MLISLSNLSRIKAHAKETFPEECCGLLIGDYDSGVCQNVVRHVAPCLNQLCGDRTQGFEIAAQQRYVIERMAKEYGMSVVGIYHSHTSCGAFPSAADCDAIPMNQSMLIVAITNGVVEETRAFRKNANNEVLEERIQFLF